VSIGGFLRILDVRSLRLIRNGRDSTIQEGVNKIHGDGQPAQGEAPELTAVERFVKQTDGDKKL
jgi:hypothetical protein